MKTYAIILSSGIGTRSGLDIPKQFLKIAGKTVLEHSIYAFETHHYIDHIIVVAHPDYLEKTQNIVTHQKFTKLLTICTGGDTRQESSYKGLQCVQEQSKILIHDAVRPFLHTQIISNVVEALDNYSAVNTGIPAVDTLVEVDEADIIVNIPNRSSLRRGQTPQGFYWDVAIKAHQHALEHKDINNTDDCSLIMKYNPVKIKFLPGDEFNSKITTPVDVAIADKLFQLKTVQCLQLNPSYILNKVILVFGSSAGIGQAIVELADSMGAKVYGFSRQNGGDILDFSAVEKILADIFNKEGRIDSVIVTAGVLNIGQLVERDIQDIIAEIQLNYTACVHIAQKSYTYLKQSQGSLVLFGSSSYTRGRSLYSTYSSIKAALVNFTQAIAEEWFDDRIRVNIINPERTLTPMRVNAFGEEPEDTLLSTKIVAEQTLATCFEPITGQIVDVKLS